MSRAFVGVYRARSSRIGTNFQVVPESDDIPWGIPTTSSSRDARRATRVDARMNVSSVDRARRAREKSIASDAVGADSPREVVTSQPETTRYEAFHARVDAVFAAVGRGTMGGGGTDASARAGDGEGAWRPRASAVVRRGRGVVDEDEEEEDDDDDEDGTARRAYRDDLDCLESDEDGDDDARRMARLRGSVGRCRALEREDDFDDADAAAMGDDARADVRDAIGARDESRPRAVPHHLAHPEKYTRYDLGDDAPCVGVAATFADEPARNARDERPNTPNAHAETSPRDTTAATAAATRPRFSREAAAKVRPPKRRRTDASRTDDARRVRVAFDDDERDENVPDEEGKGHPTRAPDDDDDDGGRSSRRPRHLRKSKK